MKRQIITQAPLDPAALTELREWLAISAPREDVLLTSLLRSALDMFEAFSGTMALQSECEDVLSASPRWQCLSARPVHSILSLEGLPAEGAAFPLAVDSYAIDIGADGAGRVRVSRQGSAGRVAVRYLAGMAPGWAELPDAIRQGVVRLAAHNYRDRDAAAVTPPPAAVTALWAPWRHLRLA